MGGGWASIGKGSQLGGKGKECYLWRGDLSPFGGEAVAKPACGALKECRGPLRSPTGINPLATRDCNQLTDIDPPTHHA